MDIKTLVSIAGVLGFFISVATFILTRIERRKNVVVEVYKGHYSEFRAAPEDELINDDTELIKIRLTNIGGVPVIVNPESFYMSELLVEMSCQKRGHPEAPQPMTTEYFENTPPTPALFVNGDHEPSFRWTIDPDYREKFSLEQGWAYGA